MRIDTALVQRDINVTPMIDVLLVLLIIYMLLNTGRYTHTVLAPEPEAETPVATPALQLVLELPEGGGFALNGQPIPDAELETHLESIYRGRVNRLLFVKPAPSRRYYDVIRAIDRAKGAGVQIVAFVPGPGER